MPGVILLRSYYEWSLARGLQPDVARALPIAINPDLVQYLLERVLLQNRHVAPVNRLALGNDGVHTHY